MCYTQHGDIIMGNMIGAKIKRLREEKHLTQKELAARINVCNTTMSQYESGKRTPSDEIKLRLAEIFNVSVDYLLGGCAKSTSSSTREAKAYELIELYDSLSDENKAKVLEFTRLYIEHQNKK